MQPARTHPHENKAVLDNRFQAGQGTHPPITTPYATIDCHRTLSQDPSTIP